MGDGGAQRRRVFLFITDAGGGHRGSALSLIEWARLAGKPWDLTIVNVYRDVLRREEPVKRILGFYGEDVYNFVLRHQLRRPVPLLHRVALVTARIPQPRARQAVARFLARERPDLCVSLMPFVNDSLADFAATAGMPLGVICTDLMDTRPPMWFTPRAMSSARFVCAGSDEAVGQARLAGAGERVSRTGLVIHPKYFDGDARQLDPVKARARFGLAPRPFTVAIVMGGYGGTAIRDIVLRLERSGGGWQVIACCGHNDALRRELEALAPASSNRLVPLGFTTELPAVIRSADVVIAKPGPATVMEVVTLGAPLVLEDVNTMPQERPNARWAEERGCAVAVRDRSKVLDAVGQFAVEPERGERMRRRQADEAGEPAGPGMLAAIERCLAETARGELPVREAAPANAAGGKGGPGRASRVAAACAGPGD